MPPPGVRPAARQGHGAPSGGPAPAAHPGPAPQARSAGTHPGRARPRLTGPEWAAAAAMVVLMLAVIIGLALQ
ncbi:hypothetical protein MTP03_04230 [Tsukamurella sp. PLM1]|nr:hypothetical protein MTP03_04230 [Tsukamurella sp. PLM1]